MSKPLDDFTAADSPAFGEFLHRGVNGYWKPLYPNELGRALKHVEADYNYKLLTGSIANYRIYPDGQTPAIHVDPENFSADVGKYLTFKQDGSDYYWTLDDVEGSGTIGDKGDKGEAGENGEQGAKGITGDKGINGDHGITGADGDKGEAGEQ